jgi:hypothetical protein
MAAAAAASRIRVIAVIALDSGPYAHFRWGADARTNVCHFPWRIGARDIVYRSLRPPLLSPSLPLLPLIANPDANYTIRVYVKRRCNEPSACFYVRPYGDYLSNTRGRALCSSVTSPTPRPTDIALSLSLSLRLWACARENVTTRRGDLIYCINATGKDAMTIIY